MTKKLFIVGIQKCATTSLAKFCDSHPSIQIAKPFIPEPKYLLEYDSIKIKPNKGIQIIGEKSNCYSECPDSIQKIKNLKNSYVLIIIRNPILRTLSHYYYSLKNGLETRNIQDGIFNLKPSPILNNKKSMDPFNYLDRSNYLKTLRRFKGINFKIIVLEKIEDQQEDLFNWLGVENVSLEFPKLNETGWNLNHVPKNILEDVHRNLKQSIIEISDFTKLDLHKLWMNQINIL